MAPFGGLLIDPGRIGGADFGECLLCVSAVGFCPEVLFRFDGWVVERPFTGCSEVTADDGSSMITGATGACC